MLDAMLGTAMYQVLKRITLPENIADVLLFRSGICGPILALADACESSEVSRIESLAESPFLSPGQVNEAHFKAMT